MSAGISVGRSLLPKACQKVQGREAGMHWSLELMLAVLYEVHPRALVVFCMLRSNPACSCRVASRCDGVTRRAPAGASPLAPT